jgi:APA family basic amino acid/polyamine antiporter
VTLAIDPESPVVLPVLRYTDPELPGPLCAPLVPFVAVIGELSCGYPMVGLPVDTWTRLLVWMALVLAIQLDCGPRHSRLSSSS